jgi:hypothetical protein
VGTMPKKDVPRASADTASGQARQKRHLSNAPPVRVREPELHHRTSTGLDLPAWLPLPLPSYAQINCRTKSDALILRRLTSDPRMRAVWAELLKRKRTDYKASDTFKYPATDRVDWYANSRELLRRSQAICRMSGPGAESAAKNSEVGAKFYWAAWTATTAISELSIQDRALVAFFSQAFEFARSKSRPVPRAVAQQKRAHYLDMANRIRTDLVDMGSFSDGVLTNAALAYEALAEPPDHPLHVKRKRRGDERQTAFVLQLVDAATAIFGQPLYGIVSIVANVAFKCQDWSGSRVRKVTKGRPPLPRRATIDP